MTWTVVWLPTRKKNLRCFGSVRRIVKASRERLMKLMNNFASIRRILENRAAGRRILIVPPLAVTYRVLVEDRVVRVVNVRDFPGKES
jgi:hypothetical protein